MSASFDSLTSRLLSALKPLEGKDSLSDADVDSICRSVRNALLEADVALPVVREFVDSIRPRLLDSPSGMDAPAFVVSVLHDELVAILGGADAGLDLPRVGTTVVLLQGLPGSGKTSTAAKLAGVLLSEGRSPLLVSLDSRRPGAVLQLEVLADAVGADFFSPVEDSSGMDPVEASRFVREEAVARGHDVVVVDTAGRMPSDEALMSELVDMRAVLVPERVLLVVDALVGHAAVDAATGFSDVSGFDGLVLTRLDGDARGGAALSMTRVTGRPVLYATVGEHPADIEVFDPVRMAGRILDMGDVTGLLQRARATGSSSMGERLSRGGDLTMEDFADRLVALSSMGPVSTLVRMLPGATASGLVDPDPRMVTRLVAVVGSMTPLERSDPSLLTGSRRSRVAAGAGVPVETVDETLARFDAARRAVRRLLGDRSGTKGRKSSRKGRRSGNPAAR